MLSKIVQSFCLQSLCCNNEYTPSWHLSTFYKMRGFIDIWCFARLSSRAPRSWREFAKYRFTHFPSIFSLQVDTYALELIDRITHELDMGNTPINIYIQSPR